MNTTTEHLIRIDTARTPDPTAPTRRLSEAELDDHLRGLREAHDQSVDDAMRLFRARPHRRASDNDSGLPEDRRARAVAARAWHSKHAQREQQGDTTWWVSILLIAGLFVAIGAFQCGRYGCGL